MSREPADRNVCATQVWLMESLLSLLRMHGDLEPQKAGAGAQRLGLRWPSTAFVTPQPSKAPEGRRTPKPGGISNGSGKGYTQHGRGVRDRSIRKLLMAITPRITLAALRALQFVILNFSF